MRGLVTGVRALVCAALLSGVNSAWSETFFSIPQVQQHLFANKSFKAVPVHLERDFQKQIRKTTGVSLRDDDFQAWRVSSNGQLAGWLFVSEVLGKHENITYALGLNAAGNVSGLTVMDYRETHGGEVRNPDWLGQFMGKNANNTLKLGKDIDNISGATLSCRHLTDGIHALLMVYNQQLSALG